MIGIEPSVLAVLLIGFLFGVAGGMWALVWFIAQKLGVWVKP